MQEDPLKVTLTEPEFAGSYIVAEQRDDGTLVLRPETNSYFDSDEELDAALRARLKPEDAG